VTRKKTIVDGRPARHDDIVAALLNNPWGLGVASTEVPAGRGFIDVAIDYPTDECPGGDVDGLRCGGYRHTRTIIEVKSQLELWSAGDVIRQMSGYLAASLKRGYHGLSCKSGNRVTCIVVADRDFTRAELTLFKNKHISCFRVDGSDPLIFTAVPT